MSGTNRTASITLTLDGASYVANLRKIGDENEKQTRRIESGWKKAGAAGLKSFGRELGSTADTIKTTLRTAATLGGAFSVGASVRSATELRAQFRNLTFDIKGGTGVLVDWQELLAAANDDAQRFGQSTAALGDVFHDVFEETGNAEFAADAMHAAAVQARATGDSLATVGNIAGTLNEKFGVTSKELPEALAIAKSLGEQGGVTFDEMGAKLQILGASAKQAGLQGVDGFQRIIALSNIGDNSLGGLKKNIQAVTTFLDNMATEAQQKKIAAVFGVSVKAGGRMKDPTKVLEEIFGKTGGQKEKLQQVFTGGEAKLIVDLGQRYAATLGATAGDIKTKTAAANADFEKALRDAGQSQLTAADIQKRAAENMANDPEAKFKAAMAKLEAAFTQPKMLEAIDRLASNLPALADGLSKLIGFVLENPGTSAAVAAGVKLGAPAVEAAMKVGAQLFAKAAGDALGGGLFAGKNGVLPGGAATNRALGATAVLTAGLVGFAAGDAYAGSVVDPAERRSKDVANSLQDATLAAGINKDQGSLDTLKERIAAAKKDKELSFSDFYTLGIRRLGTASDDQIKQAEEQAKSLEDKLTPASDGTAKAFAKLAATAETLDASLARAAKAADRGGPAITGAAPTQAPARGPIRPPPVTPGYLPR